MADVFIDPSAASNGSGSEASPKNTWVGLTWTAGNRYLQKRGTTFTTASGSGGRIAPSANGTEAARITLGAYGSGPLPKIINNADTGVNLTGRQYITVEHLEIDNTAATSSAIGGGGGTVDELLGIVVQGCYIHGGGVEALSFVTALDRALCRGLIVQDNLIEDVGGHGVLFAGKHVRSVARRNTIRRAGKSLARHGLSCYPHRATTTPSWSLVSGTIYKTAIGSQTYATTVSDIYGVRYVATSVTLARAGTAASPASGEYGFTGGELYINVGGVPTGQITFSYTDLSVVFEENTVDAVVDFDGAEGHGIQFDDLASDCEALRNVITNCEGRGIVAHMGRRNIVRHNLIVNCKKEGIRLGLNGATLNYGDNNTIIAGAATLNTVSAISMDSGTNYARNNVLVGYTTGINAGSNNTENGNCIRGATTVRTGGVSAGVATITSDPLLSSTYRPKPGSPLLTGGAALGYLRDMDRRQCRGHIGAYGAARLIAA